MTPNDFFEQAKRIARGESSRPASAYRRLQSAVCTGGDILLSDRDLVLAANEAIRHGLPATATVALDELALRMVCDETPEQSERRAA